MRLQMVFWGRIFLSSGQLPQHNVLPEALPSPPFHTFQVRWSDELLNFHEKSEKSLPFFVKIW